MRSKRSLHQPEGQVNLDAVFPGMREKYCDEPVFVEAELYDKLKQNHADNLRNEVEDIIKYFIGEGGPYMSIETDGEKVELYLDSNADEHNNKYYMIMIKENDAR